jgi:lipopolysaccharide export LptBFGC system permease protein LptF
MNDLFWFFAVPTAFLLVVVLAGFLIETVWPKAQRGWRKRLRRIEAGRARQAAESRADLYADERKRAADWVAANCFWKAEKDR